MRTAHRKLSQHKRRMQTLHANPIYKALRRQEAYRDAAEAAIEFNSQLLSTRIKLLSAEDGQDATDLLACLAVVIGTPCEAGARQYGHALPWVRQLHGALRTIQAMCLSGYTWQAQHALALDRAMEIAGQQRQDLDPVTFVDAWKEACHLCSEILNHSVRADSVIA